MPRRFRAGEEPPLREFFQQGEAIDEDFEQRFRWLSDEFPYAQGDGFRANRDFFGDFVVLFALLVDELHTLNPPSTAEDDFDELLSAGVELAEFLEGLADGIEGADSSAEAQRLLDEGLLDIALVLVQLGVMRYRDACESLRELADANDIVVSSARGMFGESPIGLSPSEHAP